MSSSSRGEEGLRNECLSSEPLDYSPNFSILPVFGLKLEEVGSLYQMGWLLRGVTCRVVGGFGCCCVTIAVRPVFPAHTLGELSVCFANLGPE